MDSVTVIGVLGSLASIGAAIYAYFQAVDAKKSAKESERAKSQILGHKDLTELTEIHVECKRVEQAMIKYGAGSTPHSLIGVTPEVESSEVQKLIVLVQGHRGHFDAIDNSVADEFCAKATIELNKFAQSTTPEDLRKYGSPLLTLVSRLTGLVKKRLDIKNSTTL